MTVTATKLDTKARATAARLIGQYGRTAAFIDDLVREYDPRTGSVASAGPVEYIVPVSPPSPFDQRMVDGDTIRVDDLQVIVAATTAEAAGFSPRIGMAVRMADVEYRITYVAPLASGELNAGYAIGLRR